MDSRPTSVAAASPLMTRTAMPGNRTPTMDQRTSRASIFLPRNSGVRPTIRPHRNTVIMANISMPYRPQPRPPKITSPSSMLNRAMPPPSGDMLQCMQFTEPLEEAVVATDQRELFVTPRRTSLPSSISMPGNSGLPACSAHWDSPIVVTSRSIMAPKMIQPCFFFPIITP